MIPRCGSAAAVELAEEGEDIEVLELPIDQALAMIADGRISSTPRPRSCCCNTRRCIFLDNRLKTARPCPSASSDAAGADLAHGLLRRLRFFRRPLLIGDRQNQLRASSLAARLTRVEDLVPAELAFSRPGQQRHDGVGIVGAAIEPATLKSPSWRDGYGHAVMQSRPDSALAGAVTMAAPSISSPFGPIQVFRQRRKADRLAVTAVDEESASFCGPELSCHS